MLRKKLAKFLLSIAIVGVGSGSALGYQQAVLASQVTPEVQVPATMEDEFEIVENKLDSVPEQTLADELGQVTANELNKPQTTTTTTNNGIATTAITVTNGEVTITDPAAGGGQTVVQQLTEALEHADVKKININISETNLDNTVVELINRRSLRAPLTINFEQGTFLMKTADIVLEGSGNLTITRSAANTDPIMKCGDDVSVSGVTFVDNATTRTNPFIGVVDGKFVIVEGNTVTGVLVSGSDKFVNGGGNIFTAGSKLYAGQGDMSIGVTINQNNIGINYAESKFVVNSTTGTITTEINNAGIGRTELSIKDVNENNFEGRSEETITNPYTIRNLKPNTQYEVTATSDILIPTDGMPDTYQGITTKSSVSFKTLQDNLSLEVKNITSSSATITLKGSYTPSTAAGLTLALSSKATGAYIPKPITQTTNEFRLTGLSSNTEYTCTIFDGKNVILTYTFTTASTSGSGSTITGGSSNSSSSTSYSITTTDINKSTIKDVTASIPVSTTSLANSMRDGKDFSTNVEGVTVTYSNGNVELVGLVPEKEYKNFTITYTDKNGTSRKVTVATFKTKVSETKLRQFIVDVYKYSLNRQADERGFAYWENQLSKKSTSPEKFVGNLLSEKEFISLNTTTTAKIEALYQVIVNRASDATGLKYWTDKFDSLQKNGYSDSLALSSIVEEMVNESEFQARVKELGL